MTADELVGFSEAAEILQVDNATLFRWVADGDPRLPPVYILFRRAGVDAVAAQRAKGFGAT